MGNVHARFRTALSRAAPTHTHTHTHKKKNNIARNERGPVGSTGNGRPKVELAESNKGSDGFGQRFQAVVVEVETGQVRYLFQRTRLNRRDPIVAEVLKG